MASLWQQWTVRSCVKCENRFSPFLKFKFRSITKVSGRFRKWKYLFFFERKKTKVILSRKGTFVILKKSFIGKQELAQASTSFGWLTSWMDKSKHFFVASGKTSRNYGTKMLNRIFSKKQCTLISCPIFSMLKLYWWNCRSLYSSILRQLLKLIPSAKYKGANSTTLINRDVIKLKYTILDSFFEYIM